MQKKAGSQKVNLPFLYPPTPPTLKSDFQKKLRVAGCVLLQTNLPIPIFILIQQLNVFNKVICIPPVDSNRKVYYLIGVFFVIWAFKLHSNQK